MKNATVAILARTRMIEILFMCMFPNMCYLFLVAVRLIQPFLTER